MQDIKRQQLHLMLDQFLDAADLINEDETTYTEALPVFWMAMKRYNELKKSAIAYMTSKIQPTFLNEVHRPDHKLDLIKTKTAGKYLVNTYPPYEFYKTTANGRKTKPKLPVLGDDGYLTYSGLGKIHRLIYAIFKNGDKTLPKKDKNGNKLIIDHGDNNRLHYYPPNLCILTSQQNSGNREDQDVKQIKDFSDAELWHSHKVVLYRTHIGCKNEERFNIDGLDIYHITTDDTYWRCSGNNKLYRIKPDSKGKLQTGRGCGRPQWNMDPANLSYDEYHSLLDLLPTDPFPLPSVDGFINIDINVDEDDYAGLGHNELQIVLNHKMIDEFGVSNAESIDDDFAEA